MATATIQIPVDPQVAQAYAGSALPLQQDMQHMFSHVVLGFTSQSPERNRTRYEEDFYGWTQDTAALIRTGQWFSLDREALAEEIESLGRSDKRELEHRLEVLVMHLLKWRYQPDYREQSHSWYDTIREQRSQLARLLQASPSLRPQVPPVLTETYPEARQRAIGETRLDTGRFPRDCPWTQAQILNPDFWPEGEGTP